jgi:hypothetical protein
MALVIADRVRDTTTTTGTGNITVSGTAPITYRTFSAVCSVSDTFPYFIAARTLNEWEVGLATYTSSNTVARTLIYSSSNSGNVVAFSAGTKDVVLSQTAEKMGSGNYTVTSSMPFADWVQSWNNGSQIFTGIKANITDITSATGSNLVDLQVGNVSKFKADKAGNVTAAGTLVTANVPASTNSGTLFLRDDKTWATPAGGSPGGLPPQVQINSGAGLFGGISDAALAARLSISTGGIPAVTPKQFGAFGDSNSHPITLTDIANNPQWIGPFNQPPHTTYPVGTEWDVVGIQECYYAAFASASTPGNVVWNYSSGRQNRMVFVPVGHYQLNRQVAWSANGWTIQFEDRLNASFDWNGYGFITGDLTNTSQTVTNISPADIAQLHVGMYLRDGRLQQEFGAINFGAQISAIDTVAHTATLTQPANATVPGCSIYMQTSAMIGDGAAYGLGINMCMNANANMPYQSTGGGNDCALLVFDLQAGTSLAPQQNTFINLALFGNNHAATGLSIVPIGGGLSQGSEFTYINPIITGCVNAGVQIAGSNALHHTFIGGDFQFCQAYGIRCDAGSINVYGGSYQNQLFNFNFSPQATQLVLDTYDILANGPGGPNSSGVYDVRSEANKGVKSLGQGCSVYGYTISGLDVSADWGATNSQRQGDVITPSVNNSHGRTFMAVDAGGPDNSWHIAATGTGDTITITPSPAYTVNALVGKQLWYRFGSSGFTSTFNIDSNTANTITSIGSGIGSGAASDTIIFVSGFTGGSAPNFNSAAAGNYAAEGNSGQGFGTTGGSAQISAGSGVVLNVGDYVVIPGADQIGVFTDTGTIQRSWPLIAKVLSVVGGGLYNMDKVAKFTTGLGLGGAGGRGFYGTPITDGNVKWLQFPYYAYYGINILENAQTVTGGRWANVDYARFSPNVGSYTDQLVPLDSDQFSGNVTTQNSFTNILKGASWKANNVFLATSTPLNVLSALNTGDVWNLTPTQNQTLQQTGTLVDFLTQEITLVILTSGTSSFTITFGTGFKANGTLATGTADSKTFIVKFIQTQGTLYETSRIGPL